MKSLSSCALVDLSIDIDWENNGLAHHEHFFVKNLNCWRDALPHSPVKTLLDKKDTDGLALDVAPGTLVAAHDPGQVMRLPLSRLDSSIIHGVKTGRFYPRGLLSGLPGVYKGDMTPFRCIETDSKSMN